MRGPGIYHQEASHHPNVHNRQGDRHKSAWTLLHILVEQQRLTDVLNLGDCALEVKCLGQNDFENLPQVSICPDGEFN